MPRMPLPLGFDESENLPRTKRVLLNGWNDGNGKFVGRPGISQLNTTSLVARGQFVWNDSLYQVVSTSLIKISSTTTGAFTTIGTIAGDAVIETAIGFNTAVIVVKATAGNIYTLDTSDTLTEISGNSNFVSCADVAHINGRFIYIPFSGDPAFFSDVGAAGTVDALSFFDAEELPDKNNACFNFGNVLYICGTDSIELFRDSGATPVPFLRVNGARINNGFIGGLLEYNQTFLFIGREKDQDFGIYAIGQGVAPKISNQGIDLILSTYTITQLSEAIPGRIKWRGFDIATFTLGFDSFGFFGGQWFLLDTLVDGKSEPWNAGFIAQFEGEYFTAFSDKIGKFDNISTDYGERITRRMLTAFEQENGDDFSFQKVILGISQGFNTASGSVALRLSQDNINFGDPVYRNTSDIGEYSNTLEWNFPGGLGTYHGFMGMQFYTTEDILASIEYLIVE